MDTKILKNLKETTVVSQGYQIYVDTSLVLDPRIKTFMTTYDPLEDDIFLKKLPGLTGLLRDPSSVSDKGTRFLHVVNKSKRETIDTLKDYFSFPYTHPTADTRVRLIDTPDVIVIDYSEKSVAIFSLTRRTDDYMETVDRAVTLNTGLTGPDLRKTRGYVLAKSSRRYKEIMEKLAVISSVTDAPKPKAVVYEGDGMESIPTSPGEPKRLRIWGSNDYILDKLDYIAEGQRSKTLSEKSLGDGRRIIEVEITEV